MSLTELTLKSLHLSNFVESHERSVSHHLQDSGHNGTSHFWLTADHQKMLITLNTYQEEKPQNLTEQEQSNKACSDHCQIQTSLTVWADFDGETRTDSYPEPRCTWGLHWVGCSLQAYSSLSLPCFCNCQ